MELKFYFNLTLKFDILFPFHLKIKPLWNSQMYMYCLFEKKIWFIEPEDVYIERHNTIEPHDNSALFNFKIFLGNLLR